MEINTRRVTSIEAALPKGMNLTDYANSFLSTRLDDYFIYLLSTPAFGAPQELATYAAPIFRQGIMAHFAGDEKINPQQRKEVQQLGKISQDLAGIVNFLWADLPAKDNKEAIRYRE